VSGVDLREAVTQTHHEEWARVVALLTRRFGDLDTSQATFAYRGSSEGGGTGWVSHYSSQATPLRPCLVF
jgi:hypothetical protein